MAKILRWLSEAMVALSAIAIILMLVLVVADVLGRAIFNTAIPGIDTVVASYLMVATIFLPLALLQILDENIAVDVLRDHVPNFMKDIFDAIANLLAVVFYVLLGWIYFEVAIESFHIKEYVTGTWDVPIWPARVFMPLGLGLGAVVALMRLYLSLAALVTGTPPSDHDRSGAF